MEPLTLQCWVRGDDVDQVFPVEVPRTKTVGFLKEAIKNKNTADFRDVDAKNLALYTIPISETEDLAHKLDSWTPDPNSRVVSWSKLSKYFSESDNKEWLIIIDVPDSVVVQSLALVPDITLNCWMRGTGVNNIFPVEVPRTKTVGFLKEAIKNKKPVAFQDIDADDLVLYEVCMPCNDDFSRKLESLVFKQTLSPVEILSDVFSDPLQKHVHVVVEAPLSGVRTAPPPAGEGDMLTHLIHSRHYHYVKESDPFPSREVERVSQNSVWRSRILDCRCAKDKSVNTVAPPIQLFNPAFAFFSSNAFDPKFDVSDDVVRDVRDLMAQFALIYDKEDSRRGYLQSLLAKVIDCPLVSLNNADKTSPDLVALGRCGNLQTYLVVAEDKNEFGDGGSDPSVQAAFSFQRIFCQEENAEIRLKCCCPTFVIAHAGPWLTVMGGIITGHCIVQRLTDFFWIPVHSTHDDDQFLRIARIFYALRKLIKHLDSWYENTIKDVTPFNESSPHVPTLDGDNLVRFAYQVPLELDVSCVTYRAKTLGDNPKNIVVKFVTLYGADAHRVMASAGLAPELLYCGPIDVESGMPSYGNLCMVVMEYVDGLTLNKAWEQRKVPQNFQSDLRKAFQHLHDAGYVYGDLRQPNVMITHEGKVQLIDFDWAGKEGEVKYPVAISSYVTWPAGVQGLAPIRKEHDNAMLDALLNSI